VRGLDKFAVVVLVLLAVVGQVLRGGDAPDGDRSPRRPAPEAFSGALWESETAAFDTAPEASRPAPGARLPLVREAVIEVQPRTSSGTGTAFAVADGVWLTARHVVEGCEKRGIQIDHKRAMRIERAVHHPNADVSLLFTKTAPAAVALATEDRAASGYHIGFPAGRPGALHGKRLGTTRLRYDGAYRVRETVTAWSEVSRVPPGSGSLGGMSGGPVFDADGRVVGVVLAEAQRRGRTYTATPETLAELFGTAKVRPAAAPGTEPALTALRYGAAARDLIRTLRVARVLCVAPG
jgi:serine protease Do